jgi:hypothetical protein
MLLGENNTLTPQFKQHDKIEGLFIPPKPLRLRVYNFYSLSIYTLILAFIISKQEQTLLFQ